MAGAGEVPAEPDVAQLLEKERARTKALIAVLDQTISALAQVSGQIAALTNSIRGQ